MARALPNAKWVQLTGKEPIFDSFFKIDLKAAVSRTSAYGTNVRRRTGASTRTTIRRSADAHRERRQRHRRIMAVVGVGLRSDRRGERDYKLGVNYVIYALTH